jgi:hypothetical protein
MTHTNERVKFLQFFLRSETHSRIFINISTMVHRQSSLLLSVHLRHIPFLSTGTRYYLLPVLRSTFTAASVVLLRYTCGTNCAYSGWRTVTTYFCLSANVSLSSSAHNFYFNPLLLHLQSCRSPIVRVTKQKVIVSP